MYNKFAYSVLMHSVMGGEKLWWAWGAGPRGTTAPTNVSNNLLTLAWNESALREALNSSGNASWPGDELLLDPSNITHTGLTSHEYDLIITILIATALGFLILATIIGELFFIYLYICIIYTPYASLYRGAIKLGLYVRLVEPRARAELFTGGC